RDRNMVKHSSSYYDEVIDHFRPFSGEPIVGIVEEIVRTGGYAPIKMDACGFQFEGESIVKDITYDRLNWGIVNYVEPWLDELESFASKTDFRSFYQRHERFYEESIALLEDQTQVRNQWDWIENISEITYDHYWITFSPLTGGSHSTNRFEGTSFKQTAMFISGPIEDSQYSTAVKNALMTRVLFTEIDHNYVNPVSDQYLADISDALKDLSTWSTNSNYPSAYLVFNEYMTWALFILYASEHLSEEDFTQVNELVERQMVESRRFRRFAQFNDALLDIYESQTVKSIEALFPEILTWCKEQT
ncbi:MAG: DUF4932 domain-containing protein, partial [Bacteroidota bacterium]